MEGNGIGPNSSSRPVIEKKGRPQEQLNCPRCNSTNTKFCYYNNYSLTQPRYFCKTCRRYWTEGGSLRNVPVGGGSRKNKNKLITTTSSASATSSTSSKVPVVPDLNPKMQQGGQDLNLAFPHAMSPFQNNGDTSSAAPTNSSLSALELLRSGMASRGLNLMNPSYVPSNLMPNTNNVVINYPSGFPMQEIKPGLGNFSVDGLGNRSSISYDHRVQDNSSTSGRLLFPSGDQVKQLSTAGTAQVDHQHSNIDKEQANSSTGYWTGMIGGGSW